MKNNRKILIAEDELLIAKVLRMQLEKEGFVVENVLDADSVVSKAIEMRPDVIILDVFLKNNTSGIEAGKKIREANINAPIIFTTGNSYESTKMETKKHSGFSSAYKTYRIRDVIKNAVKSIVFSEYINKIHELLFAIWIK